MRLEMASWSGTSGWTWGGGWGDDQGDDEDVDYEQPRVSPPVGIGALYLELSRIDEWPAS